MNSKFVRTLGWIITVITTMLTTYWVAFNLPLADLVAQLGNWWALLAIAVAIAGIVLLIFWPSRWNEKLRWALLAALIVGAFIFGGGPIAELIKTAPWMALGAGVVMWVLYVLTINGLPNKHHKKIVAKKAPSGATKETVTKKTTPIPVSAEK